MLFEFVDQKEIDKNWIELAYNMGRWHAAIDIGFHTCKNSHLRYRWPMDQKCMACQKDMDKHVKRFHMEIAYRVWGWDAMIEVIERNVQVKVREREARLNIGAYI